MSEGINRRELLKALGVGAAALGSGFAAPRLVARTENGELVRSESEYGGFAVERMTVGNEVYEYDSHVLEAMSEKNTVSSCCRPP